MGKSFSWLVAMCFWVVASLIISIFIEWIGIAFFWTEQGSQHARIMLEQDIGYLNDRVTTSAHHIVHSIQRITFSLNDWVMEDFVLHGFFDWVEEPLTDNDRFIKVWLHSIHTQYTPYIESIPYTVQTFFVRLAIIVLSLLAFLLFAVIGMVDGLVERDLRRWGGGRESSVVYNLARKSIARFFIFACVCYLSLPIAIAPAWVIIPFALAFGLSIRVSFERFKKYF